MKIPTGGCISGILLAFLVGCGAPAESTKQNQPEKEISDSGAYKPVYGKKASEMLAMGLVDVKTIIPDVVVDVKYATADNFLGFNVYGDLTQCFLQPDVAAKLKQAHTYLKAEHPELTFLLHDGARPRSVQQAMWDTVKTMPIEQGVYVSNPQLGSLHNFGAAIDLSLCTQNDGKALDMGTPYDFFGPLANPPKEEAYLKSGELTQEQVQNRRILRNVMTKAGFTIIESEWWHFNSCSRDEAWKMYKIIE